MTCRDCAEFLLDYIEGELAVATREQFASHLAECPDCREYLRQYEDTIRLTATSATKLTPPMPEALVRAIVHAVRR